MENKYILALAVLAVATLAALSIGIAGAHDNSVNQRGTMIDDDFGMMGMDSMMGMMSGNFVHDQDDIDWMREEMKVHMNFTDEEFDEMAEHCPMMRRR